MNKYQEVEDLIIRAIKRGIVNDLKTCPAVWNAMADLLGRTDNPYIWNTITSRLQSMKNRGLITHSRATGWSLIEIEKEEVAQ